VRGRGIGRFFPGAVALARYDPAWLRPDLVAGVSVAAVAVPVAIAYSQLAGVPPVYGLYASILPLVAYALLGTSRQLIVAPDAATCAIIAAVVAPLAGGDHARAVSLTMTLATMTGIVCIVAGLARLGFLTTFLSRPILSGYLNGIAISIVSGQLGKLFGYSLKPAGFFRQMGEFLSRLRETNVITLAVGLSILVGLRLLKHFAPRLPAPILAVAAGIAVAEIFHLGAHHVALVGVIPGGLPAPKAPDLDPRDLEALSSGALGLALISFNSAMVTARGFATKHHYDIDPNQEFIALGAADIGAGVLQGFAVSGADSRTAVNDAAGGKSQVTGLVAAALVVLTLLFLTRPLASLPVTVLAAVLISSAIGLFDFPGLAALRRMSPFEFRLSLLTLFGVITVGVLPGVAVAVGAALAQLVASTSHPHDAVLGRVGGTGDFHDLSRHRDAAPVPALLIFRFDSRLIFVNADRFKIRVRALVAQSRAPVSCVVLDAGSMSTLDSTGAAALTDLRGELAAKGVGLAIADAHGPLRDMLERTGILALIGKDMVFSTLEAAAARLKGAGVGAVREMHPHVEPLS